MKYFDIVLQLAVFAFKLANALLRCEQWLADAALPHLLSSKLGQPALDRCGMPAHFFADLSDTQSLRFVYFFRPTVSSLLQNLFQIWNGSRWLPFQF